MTAVTFHRPTATQTRSSIPAQRGRLALVPQPAPVLPVAAARVRASVRLTRRGQLVVLLALVAVGVAMMLALTGLAGGAAAGTTPTSPASRTVVVQPGQTLWSIARDVAPNADRRDVIARTIELNALPSSAVSAGERLAVPTS
jgi:hypothetical protein